MFFSAALTSSRDLASASAWMRRAFRVAFGADNRRVGRALGGLAGLFRFLAFGFNHKLGLLGLLLCNLLLLDGGAVLGGEGNIA